MGHLPASHLWRDCLHLIILSLSHDRDVICLLCYCVIKGQRRQDHTCCISYIEQSNSLCCEAKLGVKLEFVLKLIDFDWMKGTYKLRLGRLQVTNESSLSTFFSKDSSSPSVCLFPPSQLPNPPRLTPLHIIPATFPTHHHPSFTAHGKSEKKKSLVLTQPKALQLRVNDFISLLLARPDTPSLHPPSTCPHYPKPKHPRCVT